MKKKKSSTPDLYDLLRIDFGNGVVHPEELPEAPEPKHRYVRGNKARHPARIRAGKPGPVQQRKANGKVWKAALEAVDGDTSRLEILPDGSVVIHNQGIR